jgi:hypothetical protein
MFLHQGKRISEVGTKLAVTSNPKHAAKNRVHTASCGKQMSYLNKHVAAAVWKIEINGLGDLLC